MAECKGCHSDLESLKALKALVKAHLDAEEGVAICQDRRGIFCDAPECEDCEIRERMLDAGQALHRWMRKNG